MTHFNILFFRRGPKSHPKACCHGCGKCFAPAAAREFEAKRMPCFFTVRGPGRFAAASRRRASNRIFGTAAARHFGRRP